MAVREKNGNLTKKIFRQVLEALEGKFKDRILGVEDVQDMVEEILIRNGCARVAKAYVLYRQKRTEAREAKKLLEVEKDELKLVSTLLGYWREDIY
ncbi:ATP cone domain-containing protein [Methanococcoides methylutens]|uniref:ATP cone domain-containing protein n=1 Tax=Methanococcoides methylutens TaxID=2226 RepID=UPI004043DF1C